VFPSSERPTALASKHSRRFHPALVQATICGSLLCNGKTLASVKPCGPGFLPLASCATSTSVELLLCNDKILASSTPYGPVAPETTKHCLRCTSSVPLKTTHFPSTSDKVRQLFSTSIIVGILARTSLFVTYPRKHCRRPFTSIVVGYSS
jgi:hypothetical protein